MRGAFSWKKAVFVTAVAVFLLFYPRLADPYFLHLTVAAFMAMILASSWDILARTGQVSVGQAGLFGIGAYTAALLYKWTHLFPVLGMAAGGIVSVVVAAALGMLTLRLRGIYFSITTIAFAEALSVIWLMTPGFAGGAMGLSTPPLFGGNREMAYYLILGALGAVILTVWMIQNTRLNFAFTAIRENEDVANVMGINPTRYKILAFMISAFFTGFAGGFYSHYNTYIIPYEVFGLGISISCLVMPIFGGLYTISGPIVGTIVIKAIEEYLRVTVSYGHQIAYG
ncbi:MAG TPA: branched-chain amino acid ABC transporter permease, partial [Thermodesulfobacteriota bacterium]|nr:branched-chain amino acid ABC transporter permease [Thermodesulfobacteriota bacterium]